MTALFPQSDATPTTPPVGAYPALTNQQKVRIATGENPEPTGMVFAITGLGDTTNPDTRVPVLLDRPRRGEQYYIIRISRMFLTGIAEAQARL